MSSTKPTRVRPPAYELDSFPWNLRRVPATAVIDGNSVPHPARRCAIFVVHGMGEQQWTETSATLRAGFEVALDAIREWQTQALGADKVTRGEVPPPFTYDGYWADYADVQASFPEDWQRFNERERKFFKNVWEFRSYSALRTYAWFLRQQIRLIDPRRLKEIGLPAWLLYGALQIVVPVVLTLALIRAPRILSRTLADVRIYARPHGIAERAMVQRIDRRVGQGFLRLIGLDWDFFPLPRKQRVRASGESFVFDRVVWVAHSLGTVVSYNVLSDLFKRAAQIEQSGLDVQKEGVRRFRDALRRFITMGSPLDKFAYLFPKALRPWPGGDRTGLLSGGDTLAGQTRGTGSDTGFDSREWWINFYHALDPVSGALNNPLICGKKPPANIHIKWRGSALVPGLAHVSYWRAASVLRFILGRVYGRAYLGDKPVERQSDVKQLWSGIVGYIVWAVLLFGSVAALFAYRTEIRLALWEAFKGMVKFVIGL
ncbi:MAG: hypothetical protein HY735_17985 [Verrucomicrobia bacterium]|nr:hypothetical protein [Verrucomicrobiota bacterium]